jgi:preprotein translocase subunit SecA
MAVRIPGRRFAKYGAQGRQRYADILQQVAVAKRDICRCTDRELGELSKSIRRPSSGEDWVGYAPKALALVSEATCRKTGIDVTDSQLLAGIALLDGAIVELNDGEGKGIAAILAAYVSVIGGIRVHVVTLSECLARRDEIRAHSVLGFLGISTSQVSSRISSSEITFGPYSEYVSDYLEINMTTEAGGSPGTRAGFAIIDEADTILIDEARCSVQISEQSNTGKPRRQHILCHAPTCGESSVVESQTVFAEGRIRNYFSAYRKIAGLTATAMQSASEFKHFYGLEVIIVPASTSSARIDHDDLWYAGTKRMLADLEMDAINRHSRGQPVVIRAESEDICREISQRFSGRGIEHSVLRSGDDCASARIMADAGKYHAVTITVGSSGRGYGIRLGGDICYEARRRAFGNQEHTDLSTVSAQEFQESMNAVRDEIAINRARVGGLGGLVVLGALRSRSVRTDDWLRGLAGQRGEPGESRFYLSSEEYDLLRPNGALIGAETDRNSSPMALNRSLRGRFLQSMTNDLYRGSEAASFAFRSKLAKFDDLVYSRQEQAYALRKSILLGVSFDEMVRWLTVLLEDASIDQSADDALSALRAFYPVGISEAQFDQVWRPRRPGRLAEASELVSADMRAAFESGAREVGYDELYDAARRAGLASFDWRWPKYLSAIRELYSRLPIDGDLIESGIYEGFRASIEETFRDVMMLIRRDAVASFFS